MINKNIQVVLFPQLKVDGTKPIKIRTTIKRKVQYVNLGISVKENEWDKRKHRVKSNHPEYRKFNTIIEKQWKKLYVEEPEEIVTNKGENQSLLFVTLEQILKSRIKLERSWNRISIEKKLTTSLRHLTSGGLHRTLFIDYNLDKIKQFHTHLHTIKGLQENSMGSYHRVIRSTMNLYSKDNEISSRVWNDPYRNFKTVKKSKPKFSLKGSEVIKLENYILFHKSKEGNKFHSVCMFIFSIYSFGSRFGDIYGLKWNSIKDNVLRFETEKNKRNMSIRMNPKLENILKYYTPLRDFYKDPFNFNDDIIDEIRKWFPHIDGLIKSEKDYIKFRMDNTPIEGELLDELFSHLTDKIVFQPDDEKLKGELEQIIKTRDSYVSNFIKEFSKICNGHLFPFFREGETDYRKIKNRKESSNFIVNKSLKLVSKICKIKEFSFHEGRHTFSYHGRKNGFDVFLLSKSLGHSSLSVTQNYLNDFDNEEIMDKNDILIDGLNSYYLI